MSEGQSKTNNAYSKNKQEATGLKVSGKLHGILKLFLWYSHKYAFAFLFCFLNDEMILQSQLPVEKALC